MEWWKNSEFISMIVIVLCLFVFTVVLCAGVKRDNAVAERNRLEQVEYHNNLVRRCSPDLFFHEINETLIVCYKDGPFLKNQK